jgi:DNA repair photolyase
MYDTCIHGCKYCYANGLPENVLKKHEMHDWNSPILIGNLQGDETISERKVHSSKDHQISLFDFM